MLVEVNENNRIAIIDRIKTFEILFNPNNDEDINKIPKPWIILLIWNVGINRKTVRKVPRILPSVDKKYIFPDILPRCSNVLVASFVA